MISFLKGIGIFILLFIVASIILIALIMPQYLDKHISQVISLIGALTALVSVVWTLYNKHEEEKNKSKQFELEKRHQISKKIYQKIFNRKLLVYRDLDLELWKYNTNLQDIGREFASPQNITKANVTMKALEKIFIILEEHIFFISPKLESKFRIISNNFREKENDMREFSSSSHEDEYERDLNDEFYKLNQQSISNLFSIIDDDIKEIRSSLREFDLKN